MSVSQIENSVKQIRAAIASENIKVVSFDIFDTLLTRSVIKPADIFELLIERAQTYAEKQAYSFRKNAESEINDKYLTINDIWAYVGRKCTLTDEETLKYKKKEIYLEKRVLYVRKRIQELYKFAAEQGKKIIAVSDMYLSSEILREMLTDNGYQISDIYVSCECRGRKDTGNLYDYVLLKEGLKKEQLIHIGDNYKSDYKIPQKQKIKAFYFPSDIDIIFGPKEKKFIWTSDIDPYLSLIVGFGIHAAADNAEKRITGKTNINFSQFLDIVIFPILMDINLILINDFRIRKAYDKIYFVSRDGYLPLKFYKELCKKLKQLPDAEYVYASRRSYVSLVYSDVFESIKGGVFDKKLTLQDYIAATVSDEKLRNAIISELSDEEGQIMIRDNKERCVNILKKYNTQLEKTFQEQAAVAKEYFRQVFQEEHKRYLIFDCGYSGSISVALAKAFEETVYFDKLYVWENQKNRERDANNGTKTFIVIGGERKQWMDIMIEKVFSAPEGSCIGYLKGTGGVRPLLEEEKNEQNIRKYSEITQKECIKQLNIFADRWGDMLHEMKIKDMCWMNDFIIQLFDGFHNKNINIFDKFVLNDAIFLHNTPSLRDYIRLLNAKKSIKKIIFWKKT